MADLKISFRRVGSLLTGKTTSGKQQTVDGEDHRLSRFIPFPRYDETLNREDMHKLIDMWFEACAKFEKQGKGKVESFGKGGVSTGVATGDVDYKTCGATRPLTPYRFMEEAWRGLSLDHTPELQKMLADLRVPVEGKKVSAGKGGKEKYYD